MDLVAVYQEFRSIVRPGDQLSIKVSVDNNDVDVVRTHGTIEGQKGRVAEATLVFHLTDAEEFYPTPTKHLVKSTYDLLLKGAEIIDTPAGGGER